MSAENDKETVEKLKVAIARLEAEVKKSNQAPENTTRKLADPQR